MRRQLTTHDLIGLAAWLLLCFAVAATGAIASLDASSFYAQLTRPGWSPPAGVFGPAWTALYFLMAFAAWMVWRIHGFRSAAEPLWLFIVQLAANGLWSWVFFKWHHGAIATLNVIVLWILILLTLIAFWRRSRLAGWLLLPYLLWVTFAACLTYAVWQLNPQLLNG